jgi:phosphomannomutase
VPQQELPDPDFPTVAFPHPEEPGAIDLAVELAGERGADLVVANDPDADRCAVAVPAGAGWRMLRGDEMGVLLADALLARGVRGTYATTIVSSSMLRAVAERNGVGYAETLTGFKWIARAADGHPAARFIFGYEEALGYAVGTVVRDKDGMGAALALLGLAARARSAGRSLLDAYDALEAAHGVHLTAQLTVPTRAPADLMARLRAGSPAELAGLPVTGVTDFTGGTGALPAADVVSYQLPCARVVIRPSGTEPKVKAYLEVVEPAGDGRLASSRRAARARMQPLREAVARLLEG